VFGNPTSVLYRADLVRRHRAFFPHTRPHADTSACFANLTDCDFGFIHEALTVERVHQERVSSDVEFFDAGMLATLETLLDYGPTYLSEAEMNERLPAVETMYYECVARGLLRLKGMRYLRFHEAGMEQLGLRLDNRRIARSTIDLFLSQLLNPIRALQKVRKDFTSKSA
jgi:hypothetical protein